MLVHPQNFRDDLWLNEWIYGCTTCTFAAEHVTARFADNKFHLWLLQELCSLSSYTDQSQKQNTLKKNIHLPIFLLAINI